MGYPACLPGSWAHRFATGKSKLSLMHVSPLPCLGMNPPRLGDSEVEWVASCQILGPLVDRNLSLLPLLESICGRLVTETARLCISLRDLAILIPHQVMQMVLRVESKVLFGSEMLASASCGWLQVAKAFNSAHYRALKCILGLEGISLGVGGYSRLLWVLGIEFKLISKVLARILSTRARLLSLPIVSSIHDIARGATKVPGATWLDDAAALLNLIDVRAVDDFLNFSVSLLPGSMPPKIRIRQWLKRIVLPARLFPGLKELGAPTT